ncbi:MAG: PorT family protein [Candidatus Saccharicenans sp.]|nr:PorT family protein [Candidatus Saccharicenans sp.]
MKKSLAFFIFSLIIFLCNQAQAGRISFGVKGGLNLASISVSPKPIDVAEFKTLRGITGGIFFSVNFGSIAIQPEFMYARRGTQYEAYIDNGFYNVHWHHDYLEAILLLKWSIFRLGPARPFILAGPSYGYLSRATTVIYDIEGAEVARADSRDYFRKGELAAVFGGGFEFKSGLARFSLEGRYRLGLSSVALTGFEVDYIKNRSLTVLAGVSF